MSKRTLLVLVVLLAAVFMSQSAVAADLDWQSKQKKIFDQIELKPGDMIDKSNWQKVQNLLPPSVANYVKKGEFVLKIGEFKYDHSPDEAWDKAGRANKGKYTLGSKKEVIDKATGKYPMWVYGIPFPDIDKSDPDFAIKFMHNKSLENSRPGMQRQGFNTLFIGDHKGMERVLFVDTMYAFLWGRPDGEQPNPGGYKFMEVNKLLEPYDLAGTNVLSYRMLDGSSDRGGTYVPSLRRVRRSSGANRSDPFFGSDLVTDDGAGWWGQNESMDWKLIGEKVVLVPITAWVAEHPDALQKTAQGAWKGDRDVPPIRFGANDMEWEGAAWYPMDCVWVPRSVYIIEATPLDPYYNYGKCTYYLDKESRLAVYKLVNNKAGEHWKTMIVGGYSQTWDNRRTIAPGWYLGIDDRRRHATGSPGRGWWGKYELQLTMGDPTLKYQNFSFEALALWSK